MKKNIVSMSGGKDSTACLLLMLEMDKPLIAQCREFKVGKSVHDFEKRFAMEDSQKELFPGFGE